MPNARVSWRLSKRLARTATCLRTLNITLRKERQGQVEAYIGDLEDKISRAQIIDPTTLSGDRVVFGATVTVLDDQDKPNVYQIVGQAESDAKKGRISYESPLARALIGKSIGDEVEVTVPSGDRFYLIDKIEYV